MTTARGLLNAVLIFVGGAGVHFLYSSLVSSRKKIEPVSSVLCFLSDKLRVDPFAQIDGIQFTKENVPPALYTTYLQIESERRARLEQLARIIAVNIDSASVHEDKSKSKNSGATSSAPRKSITESDAREFFEKNRASFPGASFESVNKLIQNLLEKRENDFRINLQIQKLASENRFQVLAPMACGGKIPIPYSNSMPARGNTTADLSLVYVFNYECRLCRQHAHDLLKYVNENLSDVRLWLMPVPGKENTRQYNFAAALHCAFSLDSANVFEFHKKLLDAPVMPEKDNGGKEAVLTIAKTTGYNTSTFGECLIGGAAKSELKRYEDFATKYQVDGSIPRYFINSRGIEPSTEINIVERLKFLIEERDRLKDLL